MISRAAALPARGLLRHHALDGLLVVAALAQGLLVVGALALLPPLVAALPVALGIWWCSNTVAHNHLHNPIFRARLGNRALSLFLSALTSVPQSLWRARHLAHHAGGDRRAPVNGRFAVVEIGAVLAVWATMLALAPRALLLGWLPGLLLGMALCQLQGEAEHDLDERGVSCYGRLYNLVWFNDGHHREHHERPSLHWTELPSRRMGRVGVAPPAARFGVAIGRFANRLQARLLVELERIALRSALLQRALVAVHLAAFRALAPLLPAPPRRVAIVGGGLFPRTALVARRLWPEAHLTLIDDQAAHLEGARLFLAARGEERAITFEQRRWSGGGGYDLIVVPLGLRGARAELYARPPAPLLVHDWLWRRGGLRGATVAAWLLKRVNLVLP